MASLGIEMDIKRFWAMKKDEYIEMTQDKTRLYPIRKSDIPALASREFIWWYAEKYKNFDDYNEKMVWVCSYDGIRHVNEAYTNLLSPAPAAGADIASEKQIKYIESLANRAGFKFDQTAIITKADASKAITYLQVAASSRTKPPLPDLSFLSRS